MKVCAQCGAPATALERTRFAEHSHHIMGYDVVLLNAVDRFRCKDCGEGATFISNQEGLIAAVALERLQMPYKLYAAEIKHIREALRLKSNEFAKKLGVSAESVSRWENGDRIGDDKERTLRVIAAAVFSERAPLMEVSLERIVAMKFSPVRPAVFPTMCFEMIRTKNNNQKSDEWDISLEAA